MRAGELRHRVTIQQKTITQDTYGAEVETWAAVTTVWAKIEDLSGREYFAAQQVPTAQVSTRVTIRWRADVKPEMRALANGRVLDIKAALDPDGRKRELQLMCLEVTP